MTTEQTPGSPGEDHVARQKSSRADNKWSLGDECFVNPYILVLSKSVSFCAHMEFSH